MRRAAALALALVASACVAPRDRSPIEVVPAAPTSPAVARSAIAAGVRPGTMAVGAGSQSALEAFRLSCPSLLRRTDWSGLTVGSDWQAACTAAATATDATTFFRDNFAAVVVGSGQAFATGYYEPEITGSRTRTAAFTVPVYRVPEDLATRELPTCADAGCLLQTRRGRFVEGQFIPYFDRGAIEDGALAGRGLELAWAADPVELFFLEVQGSGRLRLPDGSVLRLGYAGQNGLPYTSIGKLLRDRGMLEAGQASMQGIIAVLRAQPDGGRAIMRENRSYVFFRELTGPGPLGALGLPVTPRATVAVDPAFVPLGAPVLLSTDRAEVQGLWIAQDTGGAIKGVNRFDTFWGAGEDARAIAGGMLARGTAAILLPPAAVARLSDARPPTDR